MTTNNTEAVQALVDNDRMPTDWLVTAALYWYPRGTSHLGTPMWDGIAATQDEAIAYYRSLDADTLRQEAAEIVVAGGWDFRSICFRRS